MKLSAIKRICMDAKRFVIYEGRDGTQWIGTPEVAFPDWERIFTKSNVDDVFDLSEQQQSKAAILSGSLEDSGLQPVENVIGAEHALMRAGMPVLFYDEMCLPLNNYGKLYVIELDKVKAAASNGEPYMRFYLGKNEKDEPLVCLSDGLICGGIIRPKSPGFAKRVQAWLVEYGMLEIAEWRRPDEELDEHKEEIDGQIGIDEMEEEVAKAIEQMHAEDDDAPEDDEKG